MTGIAGTTLFGVGQSLSRAQMAVMMWRYADPAAASAYLGDADNETGMDDVESRTWYTAAANWAVENKVINGFPQDDGSAPLVSPCEDLGLSGYWFIRSASVSSLSIEARSEGDVRLASANLSLSRLSRSRMKTTITTSSTRRPALRSRRRPASRVPLRMSPSVQLSLKASVSNGRLCERSRVRCASWATTSPSMRMCTACGLAAYLAVCRASISDSRSDRVAVRESRLLEIDGEPASSSC